MGIFSAIFKGIARALGRKAGASVRAIGTKITTHATNIGSKVKKMGDLWKPSVPRGGLGKYVPVYERPGYVPKGRN